MVVEGDIKGCFDNIDHQTLLLILSKKIKDSKFVNLIGKFLKAGYMEDWRLNATYSGTPQVAFFRQYLPISICMSWT